MKTAIVLLCAYQGPRRALALNIDSEDTLEDVFGYCNGGSCREHDDWIASKLRSLSVGDVVFIDGAWHLCQSMGWEVISQESVHIILSTPDLVTR